MKKAQDVLCCVDETFPKGLKTVDSEVGSYESSSVNYRNAPYT